MNTSPHLAQGISDSLIERLRTVGYVRLELAGPVTNALTEATEAAYSFFHEPFQEKLLNSLPADGGYRPIGIEYSRSPDVPDQVESFTASHWTRPLVDRLATPSARELHSKMGVVYEAFQSIALALTIRLEHSFRGYSYHTSQDAFRRWSRLQLNYSRPASVKTPFINELHEDGVLMTVTSVTGPGLEVRAADGSLIPVFTKPAEALAMTGEIAWLLSGGLVPAVYHQVRPSPACPERLAFVFLGDLEPSLCDRWVKTEMNKDIDIGERVRHSAKRFGLHGFTPDTMEGN